MPQAFNRPFKYLLIGSFLFLGAVLALLAFPGEARAKHCFWPWDPLTKENCNHTPPPPRIEVVCEGRIPKEYPSTTRYKPCTDANNIKPLEVFEVRGYHFEPHSRFMRMAFPTKWGLRAAGWSPHPDRTEYYLSDRLRADANGHAKFMGTIGGGFHDVTFPPGVHTLELVMNPPNNKDGIRGFQRASIDLHLVQPPAPPTPTAPPTAVPPPLNPQPTPPPPAEVFPLRLEVKTGNPTRKYQRFVPPMVKEGAVVEGFGFMFTVSGFPLKFGSTRFEAYIDGKLVRTNQRANRESFILGFSEAQSKFGIGRHTLQIKCSVGCSRATYDREFDFEVVPPPQPSDVDLSNIQVLKVGDTFFLRGQNFIPGETVAAAVFSKKVGDVVFGNVSFPAAGDSVVDSNAAFGSSFKVPPEAAQLIAGNEGEIVLTELHTSSVEGKYTFTNRYHINKKDYPITLIAPCESAGPAQITYRQAEIDLATSYLVLPLKVKAEGFYCHDPLAVVIDSEGIAVQAETDYAGNASISINVDSFKHNVSPFARELLVTVSDQHGRSAQTTVPVLQKYSLEIDPARAQPGEIIRITGWRGFNDRTRVAVYFNDKWIKSAYLSQTDPPEITIPKTATNGQHVIKIVSDRSGGWGGALNAIARFLSGNNEKEEVFTAAAPIEIYGGEDELEPTITVDRNVVLSGEGVTVRGEHWLEGEKTLLLLTDEGKQFDIEVTGDLCQKNLGGRGCEEGEIGYAVKVPESVPAGDYYMGVFGQHGQKAAFAIKVVSGQKEISETPTLVLSQSSGKPGDSVVVSGSGFNPNSGLFAKFNNDRLTINRGVVLDTDGNGSFLTVITMPTTAVPGTHKITFTTGIVSAWAEFTVKGAENPAPTPTAGPTPTPRLTPTPTPETVTPEDKADGAEKPRQCGPGQIYSPTLGCIKDDSVEEKSEYEGKPCSPHIPMYVQKGCIPQ